MKALDTNVVVRVLVNDEPKQARRAAKLMSAGPTRIPKTVLLETEWVLRYTYGLDRMAILTAFRRLASVGSIEIEDRANVLRALLWFEGGLDFGDALHLASLGQASALVTLDRALARSAQAYRRRLRGGGSLESLTGERPLPPTVAVNAVALRTCPRPENMHCVQPLAAAIYPGRQTFSTEGASVPRRHTVRLDDVEWRRMYRSFRCYSGARPPV